MGGLLLLLLVPRPSPARQEVQPDAARADHVDGAHGSDCGGGVRLDLLVEGEAATDRGGGRGGGERAVLVAMAAAVVVAQLREGARQLVAAARQGIESATQKKLTCSNFGVRLPTYVKGVRLVVGLKDFFCTE